MLGCNQFLGMNFTMKKIYTWCITSVGVSLTAMKMKQTFRVSLYWDLPPPTDSRGKRVLLTSVRRSRKQFWALRSLSFYPAPSGEPGKERSQSSSRGRMYKDPQWVGADDAHLSRHSATAVRQAMPVQGKGPSHWSRAINPLLLSGTAGGNAWEAAI